MHQVEAILDTRMKEDGGGLGSLVKWQGYDDVSDQAWEPKENHGEVYEVEGILSEVPKGGDPPA